MYLEYTDNEGHRIAILNGHVSVYGQVSMTRDDGTVTVGVDLPDEWIEALANCKEGNRMRDTQ